MNTHLIFINYRRDDTLTAAERLFKDLNAPLAWSLTPQKNKKKQSLVAWSQDLLPLLPRLMTSTESIFSAKQPPLPRFPATKVRRYCIA